MLNMKVHEGLLIIKSIVINIGDSGPVLLGIGLKLNFAVSPTPIFQMKDFLILGIDRSPVSWASSASGFRG